MIMDLPLLVSPPVPMPMPVMALRNDGSTA